MPESGNNYINIKAPASLTSNFTLNIKGENGTVALLSDIPSITATNPINITNNVISIGGLTNFGNSGQFITSTASGFQYSTFGTGLSLNNNVLSIAGITNFGSNGQVLTTNGSNGFLFTTLNNITNSDVIFLVSNNCSEISTFQGTVLSSPDCNVGNGSGSNARNTNINGKDIVINSTNTKTSLRIGGNDKIVLSSSQTTVKNKLLVVEGSKTSITTDAICEFSDTGLAKVLINSEGNSGDCELAFSLVNSSTTHSARLYFRNDDRGLDFNDFQQYIFKIGSTLRFNFDSATFKADFTNAYDFNINGNQVLGIDSADFYSDVSNSVEFNINSNAKLHFSSSTTTLTNGDVNVNGRMMVSPVGNTSYADGATNFELNNGNNFTKMLLRTTATNQQVELAFKNGNSQGNIQMLSSNNFLDFNSFSGYNINGLTKIIHNDNNSFLELHSSTANCKIGLQLLQNTVEVKLYYDYSSEHLVYESPANDSTGQRFKINGQAPSIVDANGRGIVFRTNTGNFQGVQLGNAVDNLKLNTGSYISIDGGAIDLQRNRIRFRDQGDNNHHMEYTMDDNIDGPKIIGFEGVGIFTKHGLAFRAKNDGSTPKLCTPNGESCSSDDRIKFNETTITNGLDIIKKLNPVLYNKASDLDYKGDTHKLPTEYGFIAQDVYNNCPELRNSVNFDKTLPQNFVDNNLDNDCVEDIYNQYVNSDGDTITYRDVCGMTYHNLHAINVKAIQELLLKIELLENRIKVLES